MKKPRRKKPQGVKGVRRSGRRQLTRREFIAGTTAAGVALGMPSLLTGCGSDDDSGGGAPTSTRTPTPRPGARPRETRHLHFDFSLAEMDNLQLYAFGSTSHGNNLSVHTEETRAQHRELNPALRDVPDEQLTHFHAGTDLAADAFQLLWVNGIHRSNGKAAVASLNIHVPSEARRMMDALAAATGRGPVTSAKARAYGMRTGSGQAAQAVTPTPATALPDLDSFVTPFDAAAALVFQQPEISNLNLAEGTAILDLIQSAPCTLGDTGCQPFLNELAFVIASKWPASEQLGSWMTLSQATDDSDPPVPQFKKDSNGNLILDSRGNPIPIYRWELDDDVARAAAVVAREIKKLIFDDSMFEGFNWHPTPSISVVDSSGGTGSANRGVAAGGVSLGVTGSHPKGKSAHGVKFVDFRATQTSPTPTPTVAGSTLTPTPSSTPSATPSRKVEIDVRNSHLRYLSAYAQFTDAQGNFPDSVKPGTFLKLINSNYTVLGFPFMGDDVELATVSFDLPADTSIARLALGSLGMGGQAFTPEAVEGAIITLVLHIIVPTIFLIAQVVAEASVQKKILAIILEDTQTFLGFLGPLLNDLTSGIFRAGNADSLIPIFIAVADFFIRTQFTTGVISGILALILAEVGAEEAAEWMAGPGAVIMKAVAITATLAEIGQTVGEVFGNPAVFYNQLAFTQTTTVTIHKDPDDFRFPLTARKWEVRLTYSQFPGEVPYRQTGTISPGRVDPIVATFNDAPAGGNITVDVYLTTDDGCIVGRSTDAVGNVGEFGPVSGTEANHDITIKELLIPLTSSTQYEHVLKLEYTGGKREWVQTAAPTATQGDLSCGSGQLCSLRDITISQRTGMAGYAYEANVALGRQFCDQASSGVMNLIQNVFLGQDADHGPDDELKQLACGYEQPVGVVYERLGPALGAGPNFFIQPNGGEFLVQSAKLDEAGNFDLDNPLSWGRFTGALDAYAYVGTGTGYVLGVDRQNHKMQILELPTEAVNRANAPTATPFAVMKMGKGTRAGLTDSPVAVAALGGTIFILEQGNKRIQAVDTSANPVLLFQNHTTSFAPLTNQAGPDAVYLDLGLDGLGYMYVLSFVSGGLVVDNYRLDIYTPNGNFLARTTGMAAARLAVDTFRNVYTLNYEAITSAPTGVEPSLSQWEPSTPAGCPTPPPTQTAGATPTPTP